MTINGTEIDFSKQRGYFFNMDCMKALKEMPDKSVSLAIVDPPYGAGFTEGGGCQGWFSKYHQDEITDKTKGTHFHGRGRSKRYQEAYNDESSQICQVERERERERRRSRGTGSEDGSTGTNTLYLWSKETIQHLSETPARKPRTAQKNHFVGHSPGKRVFSRAFSCLTESNNLGR